MEEKKEDKKLALSLGARDTSLVERKAAAALLGGGLQHNQIVDPRRLNPGLLAERKGNKTSSTYNTTRFISANEVCLPPNLR